MLIPVPSIQLFRMDYGHRWEEDDTEEDDTTTSDGVTHEHTDTTNNNNDNDTPQIELLEHNETVLVARGGKGGQGNMALTTIQPGAATVCTFICLYSRVTCRYLVSGSWDGSARVWDLSTGECVSELDKHENGVNVAPLQGTYLATCSTGRQVNNTVQDFKVCTDKNM